MSQVPLLIYTHKKSHRSDRTLIGKPISLIPNRVDTNISVYLRGEVIAISEGKAIVAWLQNGKLYYDLDDGAFHGVGLAADDFVFIVEQIQAAAREGKA